MREERVRAPIRGRREGCMTEHAVGGAGVLDRGAHSESHRTQKHNLCVSQRNNVMEPVVPPTAVIDKYSIRHQFSRCLKKFTRGFCIFNHCFGLDIEQSASVLMQSQAQMGEILEIIWSDAQTLRRMDTLSQQLFQFIKIFSPC